MTPDRFVHPHLEDRPLFFLKEVVEKAFEGDPASAKEVEPEVVLEKLKEKGNEVTWRLAAKVKMLRFLQEHGSSALLEDPIRVVYAAEVLNNEDSVFYDPDFIPHVTSLEMAWFIRELELLGQLPKPENTPHEFKTVCAYALRQDGFYEPPAPFAFLKKSDLYNYSERNSMPSTEKEQQLSQQKGIDTYLQLMNKLTQATS